ncbi:MAG: RNA methyltransferase [archaeon GBS-70-058]|nr:RNA methyltransferase [Candidatus Culexarchaeum nevadense]
MELENIYIVLVEPEYSGNVGFVARVMMNFGFKHLILINPKIDFNEASIYAVHAKPILYNAIILDDLTKLKDFTDFNIGTTSKHGHDYNLLRMAITPRMLADAIKDVNGKIGLIFGRESIGLKNEELKFCDIIVTIPASHMYPSLNLSHAVAIILYELFLSKNSNKPVKFRESSRIEKEKLLEYFKRVLDAINYPSHRKERAFIVFKHIIGRSFISGREAFTLMGVFRRILLSLSK